LADTNRRLAKDYERLIETGEMLLYLAMSRILLRRLTRQENNCLPASNKLEDAGKQGAPHPPDVVKLISMLGTLTCTAGGRREHCLLYHPS
jgi:hypothetical protein